MGQTCAAVLIMEIKIFWLAILKGLSYEGEPIAISYKFMVIDTNPYS